jgi:hypothetical protein
MSIEEIFLISSGREFHKNGAATERLQHVVLLPIIIAIISNLITIISNLITIISNIIININIIIFYDKITYPGFMVLNHKNADFFSFA